MRGNINRTKNSKIRKRQAETGMRVGRLPASPQKLRQSKSRIPDPVWMLLCRLLQLFLYFAGGAGSLYLLVRGFHIPTDLTLMCILVLGVGAWCMLVWNSRMRYLLLLISLLFYLAIGFWFREMLFNGGIGIYNCVIKIAKEIFITELKEVRTVQSTGTSVAFALVYGYTFLLVALYEGVARNRSLAWVLMATVWPMLILCYFELTPNRYGLIGMLICCFGTVVIGGDREYKAKVQAFCLAFLLGAGVYAVSKLSQPYTERLFAGREQVREEIMNVGILNWLQRKNPFAENGMSNGDLNHSRVDEQSDEAVMTIVLEEAPAEPLYFRGFIGQTYNGSSWSRCEEEDPDEIYRSMYDQAYTMGKALGINDGKTAFVQFYESAMDTTLYLSERRGEGRFSYYPSGEYQMLLANSKERLNDAAYGDYVDAHYRSFPADERLLQELVEKNPVYSIEEAYEFILEYLNDHAEYDLHPQPSDIGEDFVEHFLFDSGKGYCVHFASAATMLFRMYGVASRYVTGFVALPEEFVEQSDGTYVAQVTTETAHAWSEIYLDGAGWILVEATPGYQQAVAPQGLTPQEEISAPQKQKDEEKQEEKNEQEQAEQQPQDPDQEEEGSELPPIRQIPWFVWLIVFAVAWIVLMFLLKILSVQLKEIFRILRIQKMMNGWEERTDTNEVLLEISDRLYELFLLAGLDPKAERVNKDFAVRVEQHFAFLEPGSFAGIWDSILRAGYSSKAASEEEKLAALAFYDHCCEQIDQMLFEKEKEKDHAAAEARKRMKEACFLRNKRS